MTRKGDTVLVAALKRYGKKIEKYIQNSLNKTMKVKVLVEDARDSQGKASGAAYLEIEIDKKDGWGGENQVEIHGTLGFDKSGKKGKKEDEAYLDGVTVGDWDVGSRAIGLTGCSIGEFLVHMFTLFAIKAGNESVLLDNAAGPTGEYLYRQVGFIKSKGERAQYGDENEMIFPLTGKKKNKDAGQLWRERYNKFRKKLKTKIKNNENCKSFWKSVPTALEAPGPVHMLARGSKRKTRKKRGGWSRKWAGNKDAIGLYYNCWYSPNDVKYREGMTITGKWPGKENIDRWKIKKMMDSRQYDPILLTKDIPSGKEFKVYAQELCSKGYVAPNIPTNAAGGGKKKTRKKRGGNGKNNKTKKKKETKCAGIKNAFGQCMTAAKKTTVFNKRVISAQDTSLGQPTTKFASMLMGYPSGRGGGRKKKGGLLGPRELEVGRQYLYTGPEPLIMPQAEWQTPVRITVTYRGNNVPGRTANQHYFDGQREFDDIFSLNDNDIEPHIQPWVQNPRPPVAPVAAAPRPRRESMCENCTIMGGRKRRGGYGPRVTPEQARRMRRRDDRRREEQRRQQIQQALARRETEQKIRSELSTSGPGDLVTNQPVEETERSKALKQMAENNQKIIANMKNRKVEEPKKFTKEELSQIQFEPTDLKKNQIGIVNPDGSLAVASKIKVPFRTRMLRNITQKIRKKLAQRKRKTRVAPMPPVGGRKTKRRRKKHKKTRRR